MRHKLKTWPGPFQAAWIGDKRFEIRNNDRGFKERDWISLLEWDNEKETYTGREIHGYIRYIVAGGTWGLSPDICVFDLREVSRREAYDDEKN